jgi:hypothetical protein
VENERIAEDAVLAVDVDGDFAGAGLAGRAGALTWGCSGQEPNSVAHRQNS